jgi:hypothetical protein
MTNKANITTKTNSINPSIHTIEKIVENTLNILQKCKQNAQMSDTSFDEHQKTCHRILEDIHSQHLKIAVAGAIKSGKSTFINSHVGKELVKRGAGVVTSITTRIRKGKKNRANLYFKSWDTINLQLKNALALFPDDTSLHDSITKNLNNFDIRRKKDREILKKIFHMLSCDFPVTKNGIQPETLLIQHALQGFDACNQLVQSDETCISFESKEFDEYKIFTSDPDRAFYIKDVCLEVYGKTVGPDIEIADCQGADSIDPGQLALIFNYLESSNLIIYCISSRTGLRQADIVFLNQIKNLGLLDNTLFINNCDFSEHENFEDLIKIEANIKKDLEFLEIKQQIFSFSALYNLFNQLKLKGKSKLNKKDKIRLQLWQEEKKIVEYCDLQTREFNKFFQGIIDKNRYDFIVLNHFNRLQILLSNLEQHTELFLNLLSSDKGKEKKAIQDLALLEQNALRLESIVANSYQASVQGLKEQVQVNIKNAFIHGSEAVLNKTLDYVLNSLVIDVEQYRTLADKSGFNQILYLIFQDFKRKLDLYILENVKPQIKTLVKIQEEEIISFFQSLFDSFQIDLIKDVHTFDSENLSNSVMQYDAFFSFEKIKKILGLQIPATVFEAEYTSKIKVNVFADFSLHTLFKMFTSLFKQNNLFSFSPGLDKAAIKIKKENLKLIKIQFRQYYLDLETDYFIPLIDAVTRDFKEKVNERFALYDSYKKEAEHIFALKQSAKQEQKDKIKSIQQNIRQQIHQQI